MGKSEITVGTIRIVSNVKGNREVSADAEVMNEYGLLLS